MSDTAAPDTPAPNVEDQSVPGGPPKARPDEPYFGTVRPPGGKLDIPPPPAGFVVDQPGAKAGKQDIPPPPPGFTLDKPKGPSISEIGGKLVAKGKEVADKAAEEMRQWRGMEDDIDYDTGASVLAKIKVKDADNPAEAQDALENLYGKGNAGQDAGGRWWIRDRGKKVAVFGGGQGLKTALSEGLAGMAAAGPETAGALTGAAVGMAGGPLGAMAGAGIGAAAGAGLDEFRKWLQGENEKTLAQNAAKLRAAEISNMAFQAGGDIARATGRGLVNLYRSVYAEVTPESRTMTGNLVRGGARPPLATVAPGAKSFQYDQRLRNIVKGDPQRLRNMRFAQQRLHDLMVLAGIPDDEIEEVFMSVIDPRRAVSLRAEGEIVTKAVAGHIAAMDREADAALTTAREIANEQANDLAKIARGDAAEGVHGAFSQAAQMSRRQWGAAMTRAYDDVDDMVGGAPIVPTTMMVNAAKSVLQYLPASNQPTIFHEIAGLRGKITIKQAQRYRTRLFEEGDSGNLTPGTVNHDYNEVASAVDASLDPAGPEIAATGGLPQQALEALGKVDAAYKEGIAKFKDAKLNQMIRDFKNQKVLEPEKFAASLFDTQSVFRVKTYQQIVGPQVWQKIQAADTRNMIRNALKRTPEGEQSRTLSGDALDDMLTARGKMLDAIYGEDVANNWRLLAKRLRALDSSIDRRIFNDPISDPSRFTLHLVNALNVREQLEAFVSTDILRALRNGGPQQVDAAVNLLTKPGQEATLEQVIRTFGEASPQVEAIRRGALKLALTAATQRSETGLEAKISGEAIDKFLKQYTRREQEMLFPNDLATDLRIVADEMKALFPSTMLDAGMSMAAASIKGHVGPLPPIFGTFSADWSWLRASFKGWLADRPAVIRAIAGINEPPGAAKQIRKQAMRVVLRHFMNEQFQARTSTAQQAPKRAAR